MYTSQGMDRDVAVPIVTAVDRRMVRLMTGLVIAVVMVCNGSLVQATADPYTTESWQGTPPADGSYYLEIIEPMNDETVGLGQKVSLRCRIQGYPTPTYWWYKNNAFIKDGNAGVTIREYSGGSKLTIRDVDTIDAGSYKCIAENPAGSKFVTGVITISPDIVVSETSESSIDSSIDTSRCEQYRGIVCREHIVDSSVFLPAGREQEDIEQELAAAFVSLQSMPETGETCNRYIKPSICLTAFPLCDESTPSLTVHKLCHDECTLLETDTCADLYDYIDTRVELDLVGILPICSELPSMEEPSSEMCFRLGLSDTGVATVSPWGRPRGDYIHLERLMNNETLYAGDKAILRCRITGRPTPKYTWYKNDVQITPGDRRYKGFNIREYDWGSKLTIKSVETTDTGYYTCEADSRAGTLSTTGILFARLDPRTSEPGPVPQVGYCQPYRGMTCSTFIGNNSIYVTNYLAQSTIEERLTGAFLVIADDLSPQCQEYAIPSLCYFAFPFCDTTAKEPRGRDLCRDECEILEQNICKREYEIAKDYPGVVLPECSLLPEIGTKESEKCVRIGIPTTKGISEASCYNDTGVHYRGKMNRTKSGYRCQPWDSQEPHTHFLHSSDYPELAGGHSYCRNPGNGQDKPWCFTMDPDVRAEKCDIPKCNDVIAEPVKRTEVLYILIPAIAIILVIGVICACVCMCYRQARNAAGRTGGGGRPSEMVSLQQKQQVRDFPLAAVKFHEVLGEGTFGKVYKGELMGYEHQYSLTPVTIKTLREGSTPKMQQDFKHEAEVMSSLRHPNIISLLGVCMREAPLCMLFEYMPHGDLHEFLIRHSPNSDVGFGSGDDETQSSLDQSDFLSIAIQIASGMEYLSSRHFVHRDLAARNCMVGDHLKIKIADFGLSRDIYAADYYITPTQALMPLRWMAPETINFGQFSEQSDIWSFGVVIWEIYSYGLQPFYGYNNHEVLNMIRTRHILPCPPGCPPHMYALMTECWNEAPEHRPPFKSVCARLRSWESIPTSTQNGNIYSNPTASYTPPPEYTPAYGMISPAQTHSSGHKSHASSMQSRSTHSGMPKSSHHGSHLGSYPNSHPSSFPGSHPSSRHDSFHGSAQGSFHGSNHGSVHGSTHGGSIHGSTTLGSNHNSSSNHSSHQNSNHERAPSESSASSGKKSTRASRKENVEQTAV